MRNYNLGKNIGIIVFLIILFIIDLFVLPNPVIFASADTDSGAFYNLQLFAYWVIRIVSIIAIIFFIICCLDNVDRILQGKETD